MRIGLCCIGRLKGPEQELCERYIERIDSTGRQVALGPMSLAELAEAKEGAAAARTAREAQALKAKIPDGAFVFVLDETGTGLTSEQFAAKISRIRDSGRRHMAFVIGGADGLDETLQGCGDMMLSLGKLTMSHGLARVILLEQIYRAATILAGHPYHRR